MTYKKKTINSRGGELPRLRIWFERHISSERLENDKMKLCEFLENTSYKYIKIGTCGEAFMYCGEVEMLDTKRIDRKYSGYLRKNIKNILKSTINTKDGVIIKEIIHYPTIKKHLSGWRNDDWRVHKFKNWTRGKSI